MISLEPMPHRRGVLRSTLGAPNLEEGGNQRIEFPVRVLKQQHKYNESQTLLATGEKLEDLEGDVTLYRGKKHSDNGQTFPDAISYVPPSKAGFDTPETRAGYSVQLFLDERLFDQVVSLSRAARLPCISLDFDYMRGPIRYGDAPDGSERIWDNKEHALVNVIGAALALPLADYTNEHQTPDEAPAPDPESLPPTLGQVDRRFRETQELLIRLRSSLVVLTWAVLGIAGILIVTRVI
jgi:hypothetical protein